MDLSLRGFSTIMDANSHVGGWRTLVRQPAEGLRVHD
jgi:hypothetical protein